MNYARRASGCVVYNGIIYVIGGWNNNVLNYVERYNISTNTWTIDSNSVPLSGAVYGNILYNNKIYCGIGAGTFYVLHPQYQLFTINIPDSLYSKLNEIITNGDGAKVFHNNGKYTTITPTYEAMNQDTISSLILELKDV